MNGAGERTLPAGERIVFDLTIDASGVRADNICRVVETLINRLKQWRGLATRCDKLAIAYQAALHLAAILIWARR